MRMKKKEIFNTLNIVTKELEIIEGTLHGIVYSGQRGKRGAQH